MILSKKLFFNLFIRTKTTPNPHFLKFMPTSKTVMGSEEPIDIPSLQEAYKISPLAKNIFKIDGVTRVFYGKDFISISKK